MLTLVTPGTGFVDLEAKLAFGLVRLAAETRCRFSLTPEVGRYRLAIESTVEEINAVFYLQATRHYATETPFTLPGFQKQSRKNFPTKKNGEFQACYRDTDLSVLFGDSQVGERNPWLQNQCGHDHIPRFGGKSGLILGTSSHAGMPRRRDAVRGGNICLCAICGLLAVIGIHAICLRNYLDVGQQLLTLITTFLPQTPLQYDNLLEMLAIKKEIDQTQVSGLLPLQTVPLAILARYPHLAQILAQGSVLFHLALYSHNPGRPDRVDATRVVLATPLARFIDASPFHAATVESLLGSRRTPPAVAPLVELTRALTVEALTDRRRAAAVFARTHAGEELRGHPRLLYHTTGRYLAEEVCMIPRDIIEHEAIGAVADLVRYFVVHRNYGYVDAIRNARPDSHDLERTLAAMLRECRTRRDPDTGRDDCPRAHFVPLPDEGAVRAVMTLAQEAFEEVKLTLAMLGLSRREWEPEPATALVETETAEDVAAEGDA